MKTFFPVSTIALCLIATPLLAAQNQLSLQPCSDTAAESLGCELIAWSDLQKPALPPEPAVVPGPTPTAPRITVVGVILRSDGQYFLRVDRGVSLFLGDSPSARDHESERVKVTGTSDPATGSFRVQDIQPGSR